MESVDVGDHLSRKRSDVEEQVEPQNVETLVSVISSEMLSPKHVLPSDSVPKCCKPTGQYGPRCRVKNIYCYTNG